jgi:hemoglobin/transferrin/lactoferrin receptor protein
MITLDFDEGDEHKEGYNVHNIAATWNPEQVAGLTVTAGIDNLFDKAYASHSSDVARGEADLEPGRNIKVSASYVF